MTGENLSLSYNDSTTLGRKVTLYYPSSYDNNQHNQDEQINFGGVVSSKSHRGARFPSRIGCDPI